MWLIKLGFLLVTSFSKAKVFVCLSTSNEWTHTIEPCIIILLGCHITSLLPSLWHNANVLINNSLTPGKWKLAILSSTYILGRTCFSLYQNDTVSFMRPFDDFFLWKGFWWSGKKKNRQKLGIWDLTPLP